MNYLFDKLLLILAGEQAVLHGVFAEGVGHFKLRTRNNEPSFIHQFGDGTDPAGLQENLVRSGIGQPHLHNVCNDNAGKYAD